MFQRILNLFFFCILLVFLSPVSFAETVDGKKIIFFGQSAALEGPAKALGLGMKTGIDVAFKEANAKDVLPNLSLNLKSYDDGYEPDRAIENVNRLINDDVFALIGGVGTPTSKAVLPIVTAEKVPYIGPFTGAEFLRNPYNRYVVNVRASYWQETEKWIEYLVDELGMSKIAILYQDDSYGLAGLSGVERALERRNLTLVAKGAYVRNTKAVKSALLKIRKTKPDAVVMVGAYKPCAEFVRVASKIGFNSKFVNISFVGSDALANELKGINADVIVSQVIPLPTDFEVSILVRSYQKAMTKYAPDATFGFVSLEGYLVGRVAIEILKNIDGEINRESFLNTLYQMGDVQIDDMVLHYGENDNQGLDDVFMTVFDNQSQFHYVDDGGMK